MAAILNPELLEVERTRKQSICDVLHNLDKLNIGLEKTPNSGVQLVQPVFFIERWRRALKVRVQPDITSRVLGGPMLSDDVAKEIVPSSFGVQNVVNLVDL